LPGSGETCGESNPGTKRDELTVRRHRDVVETRHVAEQRGKGRRRLPHQRRDVAGPPASLEIVLAQMQQVALDLHLAGSPHVFARDRQTLERLSPDHDVARGQNLAVFDRDR
jgi:hypothetical protein